MPSTITTTCRTSTQTSTCPTKRWRRSDEAFMSRTVLGLDPGTRNFGWGVVEKTGTRLAHVAHGIIAVDEELSLAERLVEIEKALVAIVAAHAPDEASIESLFFAKDAQAAAKLGHARGVA